ncbi:MAG: hypothetical protein FWD26_06450 [Treponema sp.]|nr:hypothetical protein [Treponema sp.]
MAILQTGEYPLWFLLSENGPVHIESIEDVVFTTAFVPWPYALHIRFLQKKNDELIMTINRNGFFKISPNHEEDLVMYRFFENEIWQHYTVGGFVFYDDKPAALLYRDNRFLTTDLMQPRQRTWSFNMDSNTAFPIEIPVLRQFPQEDGWEADTLRYGSDGLIYYRVVNRTLSALMFRTANLEQAGEAISAEVFFNSAFRRGEISHPSLPPLPEGFVYTEIARAGKSLFACWEEQEDYSIGAAGFVVIREP